MSAVEWKKIWQVTIWDKRFSGIDKKLQPKVIKYHYYLANELKELERTFGDIRILYTTEQIAYTDSMLVSNNISEGEIVAIPWGGNASVKYFKGKFITADNRIATSSDIATLDNKYLYYWMLHRKDELEGYYRGAGIKHPSMYSVLMMDIPIPSLAKQQEIVSHLDTFTSLISNLESELDMRRKQYEHYRNQLLDFEGVEGVEWKSLGDVCKIMNGKDYKSLSDGNFPVYGSGGIMAYVDTFAYNRPSVLLPRKGSLNNVFYVDEPFWTVDTIYWTIINEEIILPKYFYCYMAMQNLEKLNIAAGAVPSLTQSILNKINIPLPTIFKQREIVEKLDAFENLIQSLEQEIKLRKQQYEYYREKLLSFE